MSTPAQTTPGYTGESSQQHGGGYHGATAPPADPGVNQHAHPPRQSPPPWQPGAGPPTVLVRRRSRWWAVVVALVALLSAAALVLSIVALTREPSTIAAPNSVVADDEESPSMPAVSVVELDTALCTDIGPLMSESDDATTAFVRTGSPGSAERDAAIPAFREATLDWADRAQAVLDQYAEPPRFITRTLQRFIDNMSLYVRNVQPGEPVAYDDAIWTDASGSYGGPLSVCQELGIKW